MVKFRRWKGNPWDLKNPIIRFFGADNALLLEKTYDEQLTQEEVILVVNAEIRRHKVNIEKQLDDMKNS